MNVLGRSHLAFGAREGRGESLELPRDNLKTKVAKIYSCIVTMYAKEKGPDFHDRSLAWCAGGMQIPTKDS